MQVPLEALLALVGGALILYKEKGLRWVAAGYLFWIAYQGLWPVIRAQLNV